MNRMGRASMILILGAVLTSLLWTGGFGAFVQQRMRIPLILAAVALILMGLTEAALGLREQRADPEARRRRAGPGVGWMLLLPLVVLVAVAPSGLGAAAADRVAPYTPTDSTESFTPLERTDEPQSMRVFEFLDRALWDEGEGLNDTVVRLEGLVVNDAGLPDGFKLTRFLVSCCAADGLPLQVSLSGLEQPLPNDTWVVADVIFSDVTTDAGGDRVVNADIVSLEVISEDIPDDAYESPY